MFKPMIRFRRASLPLATIEVEIDETILELAHKAGIDVPSSCRSGTCGTCMMRLVSGELVGLDPLPPESTLIDSTTDILSTDFIYCFPIPLEVNVIVLIPARTPASSVCSLIVVPPVPTKAA